MYFLDNNNQDEKRRTPTAAEEIANADRATARELNEYFKKGKDIGDDKGKQKDKDISHRTTSFY